MKHTVEYEGERKTVEAKRTATLIEVLELAFPRIVTFDFTKVRVIGSGPHADNPRKRERRT